MKIFIVGDSTASIKEINKRPETGWGEKLHLFLSDKVEIVNLAVNGRSTKSFIDEKRLEEVEKKISKGDYLLIQFGHNDSKKDDLTRYANYDEYQTNLKTFIKVARKKEAIPVILSSVTRRNFLADKVSLDPLAVDKYPQTAINLAKHENIPSLDIFTKSQSLLKDLGFEKSKKLFLKLLPNQYINYPEGIDDNTHFNDFGAEVIASLIAESIMKSNLGLKKYINTKNILTFNQIKKRAVDMILPK